MLKNSFLGRRDEPVATNTTGRASVVSPRYARRRAAARWRSRLPLQARLLLARAVLQSHP